MYANGALKPGKYEYYREDHQSQTLAACPLGAIMISLEPRNLTKTRTLLDQFDPEETFIELQSDLSTGQQLACHTVQTALTNTEPYKNHPWPSKPKTGNYCSKPPP